jgi:hypothetical protein
MFWFLVENKHNLKQWLSYLFIQPSIYRNNDALAILMRPLLPSKREYMIKIQDLCQSFFRET